MQKANDNQQQHNPTTEISDYSTSNLVFNEAPYTSIVTSHEVLNYTDIIKVLSQVELPSPSPVLATSCTLNREHNLISFHDGQSSGTKIVDEIKENVELEKQLENEHENLQERGTQFLVPQTLSTERKRRSRIHERIRALKELVPNCNKKDQASILDDAIKYIESLQTQLQLNQMMQHMGAGAMPQDFYMSPENQQRLQGPYLAPFFTMRPMIGGGYSTGHYGYYVTSSFPTFPPFINGLNPLVPPPTEVDTGLLPVIPHGEFPSRMSEPVNSTTMSSGIIVPTTGSQVEYVISSQSSDHMPVRVRRHS